MPISFRQLTPLGADRGGTRHWYRYQDYELAERGQLIDETRQALPDGYVVEEEPGLWRGFDVFPVGTFAMNAAAPVRTPKPPKPDRPVDGLGLASLVNVTSGHYFPKGSTIRGPGQIIARLAVAGAKVRLSEDGANLIVECAGGRPRYGVVPLVEAAKPLLVAYLAGKPLTCVARKHAKHVEAVSIAVGGAPICGDCLGGVA